MIDPKDPNYDSEAPTLVPGSGSSGSSPSRTDHAVQTPVPNSVPDLGSEAPTMLDGALPPMAPVTRQNPPPSVARPDSSSPGNTLGALFLPPGTILGHRYQIIQILGEGGMGAVYKAKDVELDRVIALKVIRPELASNPEILQRFKQELILARQVTDRNVIRIFDLGEANGIKFITMEYVEGESLYHILRRQGKVPVDEAVEIMRQMLSGLQAAHREGVIHRDLKPGNIMRDSQGRIVVMDFGLARSLEGDGMTRTGTMMGTMEYMSPEQAQAKELDSRSDIFTVGLICYELLTGKMPYHADSVVASLLKRMQERAAPPSDWDASIPEPVSELVSRCLERDPADRWQSAQQILDRIDEIQGKRPLSVLASSPPSRLATADSVVQAPLPRPGKSTKRLVLGGLALAAVAGLAAAGGWFLRSRPRTGQAHKTVTVLVADFTNHTGDPVFDGTLEPMFNVAMEGASFVRAYNRGTARKLAEKLPNPTDKLDEQSARLVALSQGVSAVITSEITLRGNAYRVSTMALDAATGNVLATSDASTSNKNDVVSVIPDLVAPIRKALGDTTPQASQLESLRGSLTAASLEAVHQYGVAMEQQSAGKREEALASFQKAAELDQGFARAYSGMAASALPLGKVQDAEKYIKLAMQHEDRMTERERYRVRGLYYFVAGNFSKCIEEYSALVTRYPADNIGQGNLAACYARLRNFPKAVEAEAHAVEAAPKDAIERLYLGFYTSYSGDFQTGESHARAALAITPSPEAYLAMAEAQVGEGKLSDAIETYGKLQKQGDAGASIAASGLADIYVYEGRYTEAWKTLEQGITADVASKNIENAGDKLITLANIQLLLKKKDAAIASATKALSDNNSAKIKFLAAQLFSESGQDAKAQNLANSLGSELDAEPQAYAKIISANLAAQRGDARTAIKELSDANALLDTWIGHFELGRVYLQSGQFVEADSEFDRCIQRRGETLELFLDNVPTFSHVPPVYYLQGRVREGMKTPSFVESYRTYLSIRGQAGEDPLLPEVHKRLGQ